MAIYKRGGVYWFEIIFQGERIRKSANTDKKTVARAAEADYRRRLEMTLAGMPMEEASQRVRTVAAAVEEYLASYDLGHRRKSILFVHSRLKQVCLKLGPVMLHELTEAKIREYQRARLAEGRSGRTCNAELAELSRAIGKPWKTLWPKVKKLDEGEGIGRALEEEEEARLLAACSSATPWLGMIVRIAILTGMRLGEITGLQWGRVDLGANPEISVGIAKTKGGTGRQIPIRRELAEELRLYRDWYEQRFGVVKTGWYLFAFGSPEPSNPEKAITDTSTGWDNLCERAGIECRFHDLRHTCATRMAEAGVAESTMLSLLGHMSREMLMHYSHIRKAAKRAAVESIPLPTNFSQSLPPTNSPTIDRRERVN